MAQEKTKQKNLDNLTAKVVRVILANERHALAKTKKRGEVSGGGKKPFRQKGTGRARAGSNRSPIWRGGGIVFGPTGIQNFSLKANKKEMKTVLKTAIESKKADTHTIEVPKILKTKSAAKVLKDNNLKGKILIITDDKNQKKYFKNIEGVKVAQENEISAVDVLRANNIVHLKEKAKASKKEAK